MEVRSCHYSAQNFPIGPTIPWVNSRVLTWPGSSLPPLTAGPISLPSHSSHNSFLENARRVQSQGLFIYCFILEWNVLLPNIHMLCSLTSTRSSLKCHFLREAFLELTSYAALSPVPRIFLSLLFLFLLSNITQQLFYLVLAVSLH